MEKINKIYGPPGTGKTFRLIRRVKAYQRKGVPLHKIGYFAFTKKAAQEARERIGVSEKKVPYFQTIHAFCYHLLGLKEEDIIQPYHYEDLGKKLNVRVSFTDKYNEEETHFLTCNNPYFQMIQRAINKDISIRQEFDLNEHDKKEIEFDTLNQLNLAQQAPALAGQQISALGALGTQQQAQDQAVRSAQQQLAFAQQQQPLSLAQTLGSGVTSLIAGYPAQFQTQVTPTPSPLQTALGAGATLAGVYRAFGGK